MQFFEDRHRHFLTYSPTIIVTHVPLLTFDLVQAADRVQRLFGLKSYTTALSAETGVVL